MQLHQGRTALSLHIIQSNNQDWYSCVYRPNKCSLPSHCGWVPRSGGCRAPGLFRLYIRETSITTEGRAIRVFSGSAKPKEDDKVLNLGVGDEKWKQNINVWKRFSMALKQTSFHKKGLWDALSHGVESL